MNALTFLRLLFVGSGLLLVSISIPLIQRRSKPNYWYGFRTKRTLRNPHIWYDANAYVGTRLLVSGPITTIAASVLDFMPGITVDGYAPSMTRCAPGRSRSACRKVSGISIDRRISPHRHDRSHPGRLPCST